MSTTATYKAYPAAAAGISRASSGGAAWSTSAYTELVPVSTITSTFYIAGVSLMYPNTAGVDTTQEVELDIATGSASSEVVIITIPFCYRIDSSVGHHAVIWIPITEPREVAANTRLSVRVRQSLATTSITFNGIKIFYY
jgi:hypothetical protein